MYYKITNTESEVYKKLKERREKEIQAEKDNRELVDRLVGFKWKKFYGRRGQQTFNRVSEYKAFMPCNEADVDLKVWKKSKDYQGGYVPNRRTKKGREIDDTLRNGLKGFGFTGIHRILEAKDDIIGAFSLPYVELLEDSIIIFLDEKVVPKNPEVIEITRKEFLELSNCVKG